MTIIPITDTQTSLYMDLLALYKDAFPEVERRDEDALTKMVKSCPNFHANVLLHEEEFVGLLNYWQLSECVYIEHLATLPHLRGQNLGGQALEALKACVQQPLLLEVEHPEDDLSRRRIGFYQRHGFDIVDKDYIQPPYRSGDSGLPLWLLTTENRYDPVWANELKRMVYGVEETL